MNIVLWVVQGLLALAYFLAGGTKLITPLNRLSKRMDWVQAVPPALVRSIGAAEVLGAIGIMLPLATGIAPRLTVAAAAGLILVQVAAAGFHLSRREANRVPANLVLLLLALFVLVGRVALVPVA